MTEDGRLRVSYPLRIDGKLVSSKEEEVIRSPFDGSAVGTVSVASDTELDQAMAAAARAFEEMRRLPTHQRVSILEGTAAGIERRGEELARLMARESGKPIRYARSEVVRAALTFRLGAAEALRGTGEVLPVDLEARGEGRLCLFTRVPRGPVAAISPFNFPLNLVAHKLSPAIAVGTSVLLKPPPQCPLTAHILAEILDEAGLPPGALGVVHCPPEVAQQMVEDDRMKVLSFTGSDVVGWKLKALAPRKQTLLELGGNAPCIIEDDADAEVVMKGLLPGAWAHAGQVCIKVQRVLVHQARFKEILERFVRETETLACGDPLNEDTVVGPLIDRSHVARVLSWVDEARRAGARVHCGGTAEGNVVRPIILTDVGSDQRVCRDEVFGPVTVVESYRTLDEAIARCNDGRFGLQAGLFTRDIGKALHAYRELDYGGVVINDVPTFRVDNFPYGGVKDSGFGREGVRFAMEEMTEPRVLVMKGMV